MLAGGALAAVPAVTDLEGSQAAPAGVEQWLTGINEATRHCAYVGTFVVKAGNFVSSSRIWHVGDGHEQIERIQALTGTARTTFRLDDKVVTFLPSSHTVVSETGEGLGAFPSLLKLVNASGINFYRLRRVGPGQVAGFDADIVRLIPVDPLRFGYRIWVEKRTGLVVKLETLDAHDNVLEQAAFADLQLTAPLTLSELKAQMNTTQGYQMAPAGQPATTIDKEGWDMDPQVPGFDPVRCEKGRNTGGLGADSRSVQCIFSDGLASVSVFIEPFDAARHARLLGHHPLAMGATHMRVRQLGDWWLTAVGEVPPQTLSVFLQALERKN
ncbi:sigma factor AlgU regulatory protein MucB precursor [mine drainage metagenome]|uniref:Sigma factor AlgU regulatory protein MucB n=1 Tax=mine drainage metagenome TaxID=410659 RepID=A0A1J5QCH0_9ZZZZ